MDEEVVITTPEPSPAPEPKPLPEPPPSEPGPEMPSEPEPADPVTVVSVDELIDRLVQNTQDEEEISELLPAELDEVPGDAGDVGVDDVVPGLIGDVVDILLGIRKGMENVESIEQVVNHPALTTPFQDYTVTEGLLLLLLLFFFLKACMDMIRRAFSWLL